MSVKKIVKKLRKAIKQKPEIVERKWKITEEKEEEAEAITSPSHPGEGGGPVAGGEGGAGGAAAYPPRRRGEGAPPAGRPPTQVISVERPDEDEEEEEDQFEEEEAGINVPEDLLFKFPDIDMKPSEIKKEEQQSPQEMNTTYPLIPSDPVEGEKIYAKANIKWDPNSQGLVYHVIEPHMTDRDEELLDKIKETLREKLDVSFTQITSEEAERYLENQTDEVLDTLGVTLTPERRDKIRYYIKRDFIGLDKIEPIMHDPYIEDISCDGTGIPIYGYHRNPVIASVPTDIVFDDKDELDSFVFKLAQKAGESISMADPLVDAALPDGSRLQATLSTDIARRGSNFTIRKFTEQPLTPTDIINFGTIDSRMMAYLWLCIENGKSMLMSGGTATGKTTMLNVVSLFIEPEMKIVSIEDTPELRLTHPHWVPEVARESITAAGEEEHGSVDLYDLLKSSLRQRPDYIIVGEVRGEEAYVLFQQIATGHTGLSTIHAESLEKLVDRLTTDPIKLSPSLIEMLDIVVFLKREKREHGYVRRISNIYEIIGFDREDAYPQAKRVFKWNSLNDTYEVDGGSYILKQLVQHLGKDEEEFREEIVNRAKVMEWMRERGITDYRDVSEIIRRYYAEPDSLMEKVEAQLS